MEGTSRFFDLEIVTPRKVIFSGKVESVTCPGAEGSFQVLCNHAPFLSSLAVGQITVVDESGSALRYAVSGGVSQVFHNSMRILADTAELAGEIDAGRAESAKKRAEERLAARAEGLDADRAHAALLRAVNRLKVSQLV